MTDTRGAPGVGPNARVAAEVDSGGRVADLEQRARHGLALRGDEGQGAITLLPDTQRRDRAMQDVELDAHAPAALAVVDTEASQEGPVES